MLSDSQHGIVWNRSTLINLAVFTQIITEEVDSDGQVDVFCTDFLKAFDKVSLSILAFKVDHFFGFLKFIKFLMLE